jgi:hypothetical protein
VVKLERPTCVKSTDFPIKRANQLRFKHILATYVSRQYDSLATEKIKKAILNNKISERLDDFRTGDLPYELSGSFVMYIDKKYGRVKLKELLLFNKKADILSTLNISESELLGDWKKYMQEL